MPRRAAEARAAFVAGARMVTHLFNAMSPLGHREPGLVGAALDSDVHAGLIADGVHVDPATMRIALAAKRVRDRIFLVTDAMAVAGTDLAEFNLNGRRIRRRDGRLTLDDGTLAGADIDFPGSLRVLVRDVGLPQAAALAMATRIPAELIGQAGESAASHLARAPIWCILGRSSSCARSGAAAKSCNRDRPRRESRCRDGSLCGVSCDGLAQ